MRRGYGRGKAIMSYGMAEGDGAQGQAPGLKTMPAGGGILRGLKRKQQGMEGKLEGQGGYTRGEVRSQWSKACSGETGPRGASSWQPKTSHRQDRPNPRGALVCTSHFLKKLKFSQSACVIKSMKVYLFWKIMKIKLKLASCVIIG